MTFKIPVDFSAAADGFETIDKGVYSAVVEKLVYSEPREAGKFAQLRCQYTITEGEHEGSPQSQWLSFSPKPGAVSRMKAFFEAFGDDVMAELEDGGIETDEEGNVTSPDIIGTAVEIKVGVEPKWGDPEKTVNKIDDAPVVIGSAAKKAAPKAGTGRAGGRKLS